MNYAPPPNVQPSYMPPPSVYPPPTHGSNSTQPFGYAPAYSSYLPDAPSYGNTNVGYHPSQQQQQHLYGAQTSSLLDYPSSYGVPPPAPASYAAPIIAATTQQAYPQSAVAAATTATPELQNVLMALLSNIQASSNASPHLASVLQQQDKKVALEDTSYNPEAPLVVKSTTQSPPPEQQQQQITSSSISSLLSSLSGIVKTAEK